jgi:polysaccharide deacetylase 2 family uncharacterized protein YibQ
LDRALSQVFSKFDISETNIVRETRTEARHGIRRYIHVHRDYETRAVNFRDLTKALETGLKKSGFVISKRDYSSAQGVEEASYAVTFRGLDVMSMRLTQKRAAKRPAIKKVYPNPKVAIVLDDFGYNNENLAVLFDMGIPVTFSVLPNLKYSSKISREAHSKGYEVILHLPLEPHSKEVKEEPNTINSRLPEKEVLARLESDIKSVPDLVGVSNHMGSQSTEDPKLMGVILRALETKGLFFLDSMTASKSVCEDVAKKLGVKFAKRSVFLDSTPEEDKIRDQIYLLKQRAFTTGSAIAIGHDKKVTVKVLSEELPALAREGIRFVPVSELAK